jgi:hypothetical protein
MTHDHPGPSAPTRIGFRVFERVPLARPVVAASVIPYAGAAPESPADVTRKR